MSKATSMNYIQIANGNDDVDDDDNVPFKYVLLLTYNFTLVFFSRIYLFFLSIVAIVLDTNSEILTDLILTLLFPNFVLIVRVYAYVAFNMNEFGR